MAVLNPATYTSPSGEFTLEVDPTALDGQGEGSYRMSRQGKVVWEKKYPFTLCEMAVTDEGVAAGYGYQNGPEGFAIGGLAADPTPGKFYVVIFGSDGAPRLNLAFDRSHSAVLHEFPVPLARGMFIDSAHARLIVRMNPDANEHGEHWWIYDLATGKELARIDLEPKDATLLHVVRVALVRDTPLMLIHWWQYSNAPPAAKNPGGAFMLVDCSDLPNVRTVWKKTLPGDYAFADVAETADDPWKRDQLRDDIWRDSAILQCDQPRRFSLRFVAENQRVTFEVVPGDKQTGWQVREISRQAYVPATQPVEPGIPIATATLKHVGTLWLGERKPPSTQPVRDIWHFDIDDRGRIGFLRSNRSEGDFLTGSFVLVTQDGKTIVEGVRPAGNTLTTNQNIAWLGGDRWIVTDCESGIDKTARAWFIDVGGTAGARVTKIDKFDAPAVKSMTAAGDGDFIVLADRWSKYTIDTSLIRFDAHGMRRWTVSGNMVADVAVDRGGDGRIAALNHISSKLQFLDAAGQPTPRVDLESVFGQKPNYPANIQFDRKGGIVLLDFHGTPPIWRLTRELKVREKLTPHFKDGQRFDPRNIRLSPDDRIWTSDGERLLRLNDQGEVDLTLGEPNTADRPDEIAALAFGPAGSIYTAAGSGGTVQVFDSAGKRIQVMKALPEDFYSDSDGRDLTVAGDGSAYLSASRGPYLHFKPDGSRVGWEKLDLDSIVEKWHFAPGTARRWVMGYHAIWLVGEEGKRQEIRRQPDRNWLNHPRSLAVAPDGSAVVAAVDGMEARQRSAPRLNIYAADGSSVRTIGLPDVGWLSSVVYDGKRAVVLAGGKLLLVDIGRGGLTWLELPRAPAASKPAESFWFISFSADGRELWLLYRGREQARLERYELPGAG